jgi:hypothetical protein
VARCYTESKQNTDSFFAAMDSTEMAIGTGRHNTTTQGAAVALHVQTENEAIKKTRDEPMPPNLVMIAFQAGSGANPLKILPLLKNILELNGNKNYHQASFVVWGSYPEMQKGGEFSKTHRPT